MVYKERLLEQGLFSLEKNKGAKLAIVSLHKKQLKEYGSDIIRKGKIH